MQAVNSNVDENFKNLLFYYLFYLLPNIGSTISKAVTGVYGGGTETGRKFDVMSLVIQIRVRSASFGFSDKIRWQQTLLRIDDS